MQGFYVFHTVLEVVAVDAIAIANEQTRRFFIREGVNDLLGGAFSERVRGDADVNETPPVIAEHNEDVQDTSGRRNDWPY